MFKRFLQKKQPDETLAPPEKPNLSWRQRLWGGLKRTRQQLGLGRLDDKASLDDVEMQLLSADVGLEATEALLAAVSEGDAALPLKERLQQALLAILQPCQAKTVVKASPHVQLMVGVNGVGKTTTIGKLAHHYQQHGQSVLLAAGDTFRAAANQQLLSWGKKNGIDVIGGEESTDSAAVIFDAVHAAKARGIDRVIADTAGRLHTQTHLMKELEKIQRVIKKLDETAPHEVTMVLDATIGQNALNQIKVFHEAIGLDNVILTKLDGSAKGGVLVAIAKTFALPIEFIGVGEGLQDLQPFDAEEFIEALCGYDRTD